MTAAAAPAAATAPGHARTGPYRRAAHRPAYRVPDSVGGQRNPARRATQQLAGRTAVIAGRLAVSAFTSVYTVSSSLALPPGCAFEPRCELRRDECALAVPAFRIIGSDHAARCILV